MPRQTGTYRTTTTTGEAVQAFVPHPLPPADPPLNVSDGIDQPCAKALAALARLDIIASTARLLDRASNRSQQNLVIESLLADIQSGDEKTKIESELNEIKARADAITKIRHKVIAHEDKLTATGLADLAPADKTLIGELIDRINALMRAMESAAHVPYPHAFNAVSVRGSGETVLWLLRLAASGVSPNAELPDGSNVAMIPVRSFS